MNLFEKMYVGIRNGQPRDMQDYPLGFMTHFGTDSAFRKRKETVDAWSRPHGTYIGGDGLPWNGKNLPQTHVPAPPYEPEVLDNEATTGFVIEKSVSRWSTSNKLFRINDPRGFSVEISAANLSDVISNCTIIKGEIQEKLVWTRAESNNFLTRLDHPDYVNLMSPVFDRAPMIGDLVEVKGTKMLVLGDIYTNQTSKRTMYQQRDGSWSYTQSYGYGYGYGSGNTQPTKQHIEVVKDPKPWKLMYDPRTSYFHIIRKYGKLVIVAEKQDISNIQIPYGKKVEKIYSTLGWAWSIFFFKTKSESVNSPITEADA